MMEKKTPISIDKMNFLKDPNTCLHRIHTECYKRIDSILKNGILSRKLLRKNNISIENGFAGNIDINENYVSVSVFPDKWGNPEKFFLEIMNDPLNITLIIRGNIQLSSIKDKKSDESSRLVKDKIPLKFIIGVAIASNLIQNYYNGSYPIEIIRYLKGVTKKYNIPLYEVNEKTGIKILD
jgi:hypothetical protein